MKLQTRLYLFTIFLIVVIGAGVFYFVFQPIEFERYDGEYLSTMVPKGWNLTQKGERGWESTYFTKGRSWLGLSRKKLDRDAKEMLNHYKEDDFKEAVFNKDITVYNDGFYAVFKSGKSYRRYVALFTYKGFLYWFESSTKVSSTRRYKDVLDTSLINLSIDNEVVSPDLKEQVDQINQELSLWITQGEEFWVIFAIGLPIIILIPVVLISKLSGKLVDPRKLNHEVVVRKASQIEVSAKARQGYKLNNCSVYLTENRFIAFMFGREFLKITADIGKDFELSVGVGKFFGGKYLQIIPKTGFKVRYKFYLEDANIWEMEIKQRFME